MPVNNAYWLALAVAGVLMALPLSWLSLGLLLFVPGLSAYTLIRKRFRLVELVALSFTLSLVLFALTTLVTMAVGVHGAPVVLGAFAVIVSLYHFSKRKTADLDAKGWQALALAIVIAAIVLLVLLFNTYTFRDGAFYVQPTYACDGVFHLSIIERYITAPQVPPQEPFLPGYDIVYNWLVFVTIGELVFVTGAEVFLAYKFIVALVAGLIFLTAYLLADAVFKGRTRAALIAALVFVAGAGLSWAFMLFQQLSGKTPDLFYDLVYNWDGVMSLKYDPVSLFFFLPQPQTFALLLMIAGLYMYYVTCRDRSPGFGIVSGLTLAALIMFHLMSAFATLIPLGLFFLNLLYTRREAIIGKKDWAYVAIVALPLVICFFAGVYQITLLTENAASHVEIGHHPDVYVTMLFALGPLIPFALYGAYRLWREEGAMLLLIFGLANFVFINVLELPRSMDTYRFFDFLSLPMALFAGYAFWEMLKSSTLWKKALAVLVILLIVPSSLITAVYYTSPAYQQAPADDVTALQWMKDNTPANAIVFENPSPFPRVSLLSGRVVSYTGQYMDQFHGINLQWPMEQIMRTTNSTELHQKLVEYNVSYVFLGSQERGSAFAVPLKDPAYFEIVYGDESSQSTKIYRIL
ncbi:MAG TPA: hypothetical protein VGJ92_05195 [Methanocella sp.]